jgi:uncharacterized protein
MRAIELKGGAELAKNAGAVMLDLKAIAEDGTFEGYASTFGNVDNGGDRVLAGAFAKSISRKTARGIKMLRDHDHRNLIGEWVEVREDAKGLFVKGRIFTEITLGKETLILMRAGQLAALSIGYRTIDAHYSKLDDVRDLRELDLWEISVVPFPMNEMATIDAVKQRDWSAKDVERCLCDAGMPNAFAKMVANHGVTAAKAKLTGDCREGGDGEEKELAGLINGLASTIEGK